MTTTNLDHLHAILDGLTNGQHATARFKYGDHRVTTEGPVCLNGKHVHLWVTVRYHDGVAAPDLTAFETTTCETVTVTRDDEKALHAAIDALNNGDKVTAEWREDECVTVATGSVSHDDAEVWVEHAAGSGYLRFSDGTLRLNLHSLTVTREATVRWERGDE